MFLSIYHNQSGDEYVRRLSPTETLDLREHVLRDRRVDGERDERVTAGLVATGLGILPQRRRSQSGALLSWRNSGVNQGVPGRRASAFRPAGTPLS